MKRTVTLKFLPEQSTEPTILARFHREARAAARLQHNNVVGTYDVDCLGKLHFLVAEYVDGSNLEHVVGLTGPMEVARAANYISQAAEGLQHAHEMGMVHRDVKPSNFLLDRSGTVKLLDLGLARLFQDETDGMTQLENGRVMLGTIDYLAPEQAVDSHDVDIRADIYGLGATFFFLLTGRTVFEGASSAQKLAMHNHRPAKRTVDEINGLPKDLARVIEKMLAKNREYRYQSPEEVVEALAPWTSEPIPPPTAAEMPKLCAATRAVVEASRSANIRVPNRPMTNSSKTPKPKSNSKVSLILSRVKATPSRADWPYRKHAIGLGAVTTILAAVGLIAWSPWQGPSNDLTGVNFPVASRSASVSNPAPPPSLEPITGEAPRVLADSMTPVTRQGKYLTVDLKSVASIVTTKGMFWDAQPHEQMVFDDWSTKTFEGVPFQLVDPQGSRVRNAVMLHGPRGDIPPKMPKSVTMTFNAPAKSIHFLSGVSAWGSNGDPNIEVTTSMIVRVHYANGQAENFSLKNGIHFADYIRVYEVPGSKLAYKMAGDQQLRYLSINPDPTRSIVQIDLVKGTDDTVPIVMAMTFESP